MFISIVEDDDELRFFIVELLKNEAEFSKIEDFADFESFHERLDSAELPDVLLIDINLPGIDGIEGIRKLSFEYPKIKSIVLTVYEDQHKIFESLRAGASGYILKASSLNNITEIVKTVSLGGAYMSPEIAKKVFLYFNQSNLVKQIENAEELSAREKDVVIHLSEGKTYPEAADQLHISVDTVRFHVKKIYKKLEVNSRKEMIQKVKNLN